MERTLAARLILGTDAYDASLYNNLAKLAGEYIKAGVRALNQHTRDFDAANDAVQCFGQMTLADFEKQGPADPKHFIHPMTATEMATLTTFVSQILFGSKSARKVEPRGDEDEQGAEQINELLQWNDDQQATYAQGYEWIWDAVVFNRGIMYERWTPKQAIELEPVEEDDHNAEPIHGLNARGQPRYTRSGEPIMVQPKTTRFRKRRKTVGGYTGIEIVSPYDFICDPMLPLEKMQTGRFAGHRVMIPWHELERRSKLPEDDYDFVLPDTVKRLKQKKTATSIYTAPGGAPASNTVLQSRSFLERTRRTMPQGGIGATDAVNKEDGGMVECWVLYVTLKPSAHDIYEDDDENERVEFLVAGEKELLACNVQPNKHDQFPYAVGEARPNAHRQFSPSWAMVIKGPQDHVDDLNWRHTEHLARSGVILLADGTKCEIGDFTEDTGRIRQVILVKEMAAGTPLDNIVREIKISDPTTQFPNEIELWKKESQEATGAHAFVQGVTDDPSQTATQFEGTQTMATGRISSIARLLSVQALVPQTRRIAMNFQQFLPDEVTVRIRGESEFDPDKPAEKTRTILRDRTAFEDGDQRQQMPDIQCEFDCVPHDGSLPNTDTQKVAALSRAIEAFSSNPTLAPLFDETIPGAFNVKTMFEDMIRIIGLNTRNKSYRIDRETAMKNLHSRMMASGMPVPPGMFPPGTGQPQPAPTPAPVPQEQGNVMPFPSASELPPTPTAEAPNPAPMGA